MLAGKQAGSQPTTYIEEKQSRVESSDVRRKYEIKLESNLMKKKEEEEEERDVVS